MSQSTLEHNSYLTDVKDSNVNGSYASSSDQEHAIIKPLSLWRKLTFAAGGLPMQLMQNVIGFFLPLFLLETVNLAPAYLSIILLAARISDAITDPIVGLLVLKTKSRFGQKRPWILFSTPLFVASFFALFYAVQWSDLVKLCFYMISIVFLQIGLTAFHVPYSSLTMVLTHVPKERDALTAFRMFSEVLGILLGVAVFGAITAPYRVATSCENSLLLNVSSNATSTDVTPIVPTTSSPTISQEAKELEAWAYMTGAAVTCAISATAALVCFFGTREVSPVAIDATATASPADARAEVNGDSKAGPVKFLTCARCILTYSPYLYLMGAFLFMSLGLQFLQGNISLYITHSIHMSAYLIPGVVCLLGTTILFVPVTQLLLRRLGKKNIMALGIMNAFPLLILLNFIPERPPLYVFFGMMIWASITIAVAMLLPWSMLPDVIDAFTLQHNMSLEPVFYSLIVFFNKFAVGISLAVSAGILGLAGYDSSRSACTQPPEVGKTLRLLSSIAPIGFFILALILLYFYPLGNQQLKEMRSKMLLRSNASTQDIINSDAMIDSDLPKAEL